jgi:hypothetical protein
MSIVYGRLRSHTRSIRKIGKKMNSVTAAPCNAKGLQMVLHYPFSIDVSGPDAVVISQDELYRVRLEAMSPSEFLRLEAHARQQYVTAVLSGQEDIDEKRATLFFLAAYMVRRNRPRSDKSVIQERRSATNRAGRRHVVA